MSPTEKTDLLQGTLDMLILKIVAFGPVHGYGIAQRIRQISKLSSRSSRARSIPRCIAWKNAAGSPPTGANPKTAARPASTSSPPKAAASSPQEEDSWNRLSEAVAAHPRRCAVRRR